MAWWKFWKRKQRLISQQVKLADGGVAPAGHLTGKERADEWLNIISGHGMKDRDKRTAASFVCDPVTNEEARELLRGDDIVQKIVYSLPREMVRQGYVVNAGKKGQSERITDNIDTLGINRAFVKAKNFERAYGGAAIYPVLNDGSTNLAMPLKTNSINKVRFYRVFEARELQPATWYTNPNDERYGEPETYRVIPIGGGPTTFSNTMTIHETRLVIFPGVRVSNEPPAGVPWGWGDSVLTPVRAVLRDFHLSWASVGALLVDVAQGIFKMHGLSDMLENNRDDVVEKRLQVMDYSRSVMQSLAIDGLDDFTRISTPMTGVPDILIQFATRLAAAAKMPVTRLMGISPAGLNATGESDTRNWYDDVAAEQESDRPLLERLIRFTILQIDGPMKGIEPDVWSVEFNPLWQPSAQEDATTRKIIAETDQIYIDAEVVSREEVAWARWGGDKYSGEMNIDWKARKAQREAAPGAVLPEPAPSPFGNPFGAQASPPGGTTNPDDPSSGGTAPDDQAAKAADAKGTATNGTPKKQTTAAAA